MELEHSDYKKYETSSFQKDGSQFLFILLGYI